MTDLKPCPFCGGKARPFELTWHAGQFGAHMFEKPYWQVICGECKAAIGDFDSKAKAFETWNTRHVQDDGWEYDKHSVPATEENMAKFGWVRERTCKFTIKDNMNETEGMGDVWIECSACNCVFDFYADEWLMKMSYCPNCGCKVVDA